MGGLSTAVPWRERFLAGLAAWVLAAVAAGLALPLPGADRLVLPVLFVMVGSISLTLDTRDLRRVPWRLVALVTLAGAALPAAGWLLGRSLGLESGLLLGLVLFLAAPPELTTPVLTRISWGDTPLSAATLVAGSLLAMVVAPLAVGLAGDAVAMAPLAVSLAWGVVLPMGLAVLARARWRPAVARRDEDWPILSAAMLVLVMYLVASDARGALLAAPGEAGWALAAGLPVLLVGGAIGWWLGRGGARGRAAMFSLGVRDFAVAAALAVASGLPAEAAVAPLALGLVELVAAAGVAGWMRRAAASARPA